MTKYKVYTRYYNVNTGKCITNTTSKNFIPCSEWRAIKEDGSYVNDKYKRVSGILNSYEIKQSDLNDNNTYEIFDFHMTAQSRDDANANLQQIKTEEDVFFKQYTDTFIEENNPANDKFDMVFYYTGVSMINATTNKYPYVLCDQFAKVNGSPWFEYAIYDSLESAMNQVKILANKIGRDNVKLGKVVPIENYLKLV